MLDKVLNTAEDFIRVGNGSTQDLVRFAFPLKGEVAEQLYKESISNPEDKEAEGFKRHWKFNKKTGLIEGSSTILGVRFDEKARVYGFAIPTVEEARKLDAQGKLSNAVYRDFGKAIYTNEEPNSQVAQEIISQAEGKELPLLIPFSALTSRIDKEFPWEVALSLTEKAKGLKYGKEAKDILAQFNHEEDSGAQRVDRYRDGIWDAGCLRLDYSDSGGRVDWLCGEATRADLSEAYEKLMVRKYDNKIKGLTTERDRKTQAFVESLEKLE